MATISDKRPHTGRRQAALAAICAVIVFIVYIPALSNGFIEWWDDQWYVTLNQGIRKIDAGLFIWAFTSVIHSNWHPLTIISYAVDYAIWGLDPFGYHLANNILHAVNTGLVFMLAVRVSNLAGRRESPAPSTIVFAAVTALLFGLHPLHVESVAWISERKDLLSTLFFLLSVLSYLKYASTGSRRLIPVASILFFILALLSKPMAISLPIVLLLLDYYPLRALDPASFKSASNAVIRKAPFFILSGVSAILTIWAQKKGIIPLDYYPLPERLALSIWAYAFYAYKMLIPFGLAHLYPRPEKIEFLSAGYIAAYALFTALTVGSVIFIKKYKALAMSWAYFVITLIPVIGIVQVGEQAAADRYTYLPSISLFLLAGALAGRLAERFKLSTPAVIVMLTLFFAPLSYLTIKQTGIWKDSITLLSHEIKTYPSIKAFANRAEAYSSAGEYEKAVDDYTEVIKRAEAEGRMEIVYRGYVGRGTAEMKGGRVEKATGDFTTAIDIAPGDFLAYNNLGNAYRAVKDYERAVSSYMQAIERGPGRPEAYFNLAITYLDMGDNASAMRYMDIAASLGSNEASQYLATIADAGT